MAQQYGYKSGAKGVLVMDVDPGSDAQDQGLRAGMVIDRVGQKPVTTADELAQALAEVKEGQSARLRVLSPDEPPRYLVISRK
jgi:serine protease Do